ncbi:MAG: hypothetical protein KKC03_06770 [Bacteroidetes bacterium]|nr:hypothetical protein [Bacteroidota bacterium]
MKNLKIFALLLCSVFVLSAFSPITENGPGEEEKMQQEISRLLENPSFVLRDATHAEVQFMLNRKGEIVVIDVAAENDVIASYIKNRLNYQKLQVSKELLNKKFSLPVHIQVL